jgi:hypothetical protein
MTLEFTMVSGLCSIVTAAADQPTYVGGPVGAALHYFPLQWGDADLGDAKAVNIAGEDQEDKYVPPPHNPDCQAGAVPCSGTLFPVLVCLSAFTITLTSCCSAAFLQARGAGGGCREGGRRRLGR